MAFNPQEFAKKYTEVKPTSSFDPTAFASKYTAGTTSKDSTKSSKGLYNLAVENGLQKDADRILEAQKGEQTNTFWSGGVVMDTIDTLNALQHGVTGILKGESFMDGIRNRASFSDKDALGDRGLPGVIAGIALDIAVDPLTYLAPYTLVKRIPMAEKVISAGKKALFGEKVVRAVDGGQVIKTAEDLAKAGVKSADDIGVRTFEDIEGGTRLGRLLTEKLAYSYGKDPVFMEIYERGTKNMAVTQKSIVDLGKQVANLSPDVAKQLVKVIDDQGRLGRVPFAELAGKLSTDQLAPVAKLYNYIDNLGKEAVDLGLLSRETYEQNLGEYLKNAYLEFEQKKGAKLPFGYTPTRIKSIFKREEVLSEARKADRIENPAYLLMKSAIDLSRDVENAKLFKQVAQKFGTDVAQPGFTQMPKTAGFVTSQGLQAGLKKNIGDINTQIKPLLRELKRTFASDRTLATKVAKLERLIQKLTGMRADELLAFLNEGAVVSKVSKVGAKVRGWAKLPENLQSVGKALSKYKTLEEALESPIGVKLEKLYEDGVLERAGFKDVVFKKGDKAITVSGLKQFFKFVTKPFTPGKVKTTEKTLVGNENRLVKLQSLIERYMAKSKTLSEIDKRSINDSFRYLEKNINDLRFAKEGLQQNIADAKLGDLAGKYVPDHMAAYLNEMIEPAQDTFGRWLIGNFKFAKVVMNPATHVRNIISNMVLNYWKLGMNPLDPRTIKAQKEALAEIAKGTGKWTDEATPLGYNLDTFASAELKNILESPEMTTAMGKAGSSWQKAKKKLGDIYQGEENFAKLTAYIYQREVKKMNPEDAWKAAESATFNYAQVTPFIRKVRTSIWGMPFITFSYKATPLAIETALKNPGRISVIGKIKNAIEEQSDLERTDRERAAEPPWVKDGFYIKLPGEDQYGRSKYFDLTYILPFGDLVSGSLFERGMKSDTGTPESPAEAALRKNPVTQLIMELGKNRNFYGNKIWRDSDPADVQTRDILLHIAKTYSPPLLGEQLPNGYNARNGERDWKGVAGGIGASDENQQRTLIQELLRNAGIKIQPMSAEIQETYQEWNQKKALETLLKESGVLKGMEINYVPKEND